MKKNTLNIYYFGPFRMRLLIAAVMLVICMSDLQAQQDSRSPLLISEISGSPSVDKIQAQRIQSLAKDLQPAIYSSAKGIRSYGENATVFHTGLKQINSLTASGLNSANVGNVEMIVLRAGQAAKLKQTVDPAVFTLFPKLKYIYVVSAAPASASDITALLRNIDPSYIVVYNIATSVQ